MILWDRTPRFLHINGPIRTAILVMVTLATPLARADEPKASTAKDVTEELRTGKRPASVTIEMIMERAVQNIATRYNLNENQTEITRQMMKDGVYRFLEEHEKEVWPIIRDLLASQLKAPEDPQDVKRIGKTARPLARAAEKAIYEANDIWREILTPEQVRVHDFDMSEMKRTFREMDDRLHQWEEGQPLADSIFPQPRMDGDPPRPNKPRDKGPVVVVFDPKTIFERLVEQFIKEYPLDEGQVTAAKSILEEFKVKANSYWNSKKREFTGIAAKQQEALDAHNLKGIKKAAAEHKKLLEPVYQLCSQMEDRLDGLLTTAQIQQHAEKAKTRREPLTKTRTVSAAKVKTMSPKKTTADKTSGTEDKPKSVAKKPDTEGKPESKSDKE